MKQLLLPKYLLLIVSLVVITAGLLTANRTTDFHFHDTFFIINNFHVGVFIGGFFLLQAVLYFLTDTFRQWRSLQYFHVISTGLTLLLGMGYVLYHILQEPRSLRYYELARTPWYDKVITLVLLTFILAQILFIINLIAGFIRGKKVLNRIR